MYALDYEAPAYNQGPGRRQLSTTETYTRVNIKRLKAVHERTHPGANLDGAKPATPMPMPDPTAENVLDVLEAEAREKERGRKPK